MTNMLYDFQAEENGAVTVDWVVLSAAVMALAMLVLMPIAFSADSASNEVADYIANHEVGYENISD